MESNTFDVVTGAFSYTGKYIAQRLLGMGRQAKTLTNHPDRPDPFGGRVQAMPYNFDRPDELRRSLEGADTLYNTYWIRFPRGELTYQKAVENTRVMIRAAEDAGVRRIAHVSITNASPGSHLPYFSGKGQLEEAIRASKLTYAIVRPTVIFGREDILVNNIAWALRRFPLFTIFGSGDYRIQPIYAEDMAEITVGAGQRKDNVEIDAVGPEVFTFEEMVRLIADKIGCRRRLVHARPGLVFLLSSIVGLGVRDVTLTRDEIAGLMADLLVSAQPPTGRTRLSDWLEENASWLGTRYASEVARHYR